MFLKRRCVFIIINNQKIEVSWNQSTKDWYIQRGYNFTKYRDKFVVNVNDLPEGSTYKILIKCDYCGKEYKKPYREYLKQLVKFPKNACVNCAGKKLKDVLSLHKKCYYDEFNDLCNENGYVPISQLDDYVNATSDLFIECPKHKIQKTNYIRVKQGRFCPLCGYEFGASKNKKNILQVIKAVKDKGDEILNPEKYVNMKTNNLKIKCKLCNNVWTTSLASLCSSDGLCPDCGIKKCAKSNMLSSSTVTHIISSKNNNILLNPEDYKGNNIRNLKVKCKCGNVYTVSLANYVYNDVIRCPQCTKKESRGERIIREFLEANKINFQQEQRFSDCVDKRTLPFDFYLPEYNTCIEFDGQHHYFPIYNDDIHFEITKKHDKIKTQYCDNNNIKLIRIPYWQGENINSILQKELCI